MQNNSQALTDHKLFNFTSTSPRSRPLERFGRSAKKFKMRNLLIMAALFSFLTRLMGAEDKPAFDVVPIYKGMRSLALKLNDKEVPDLKGKPVFAVLAESGFPEAAYTLVAAGDGAASL